MEAIILAGGLGTRLRSVTDLPKPLAPVAGRPFLEILLSRLALQNFETVVLSVGYRAAIIQKHFGDAFAGIRLVYAVEEAPLGTGGAMRLAFSKITAPRAFVLNGDTFVDLDYCDIARFHEANGRALTMVVKKMPDTGRYGTVEVADHRVRSFAPSAQGAPGYINAGVYLIERNLVEDRLPHFRSSFEGDFLMKHVATLRPAAYVTQASFIDIGVPEDYERAQTLLKMEAQR